MLPPLDPVQSSELSCCSGSKPVAHTRALCKFTHSLVRSLPREMVRLYHLSLLLLAGLVVAAAVAADLPGGKKVTITMRYAAAEQPGKKIRISVRYADEDRGSDDQFQLDSDDDEPLGLAVKYLLTILEEQRDYEKASRSEL